ncbi:hypothetical protein JL722_12024 [Aureococcus anophagefferens]|nr:hypothetical protein JL722_12024 [Aureococcus anophagefferens]
MNEVIKTYRELFNGDSDSDDDSVEEAREARRHAKQAGVPAGRLGFVMPKGHGPGDYGSRSAAVEQRNFAASSHRMATPENEGFAAYGAMSAEEAEFFEQPDSVIKLVFGAWREDTLKIRARRLRKREKHVEARKVHRKLAREMRAGKQPARGAYHVNKVLAGASVKDLKASRVTLASKDVKALYDWRGADDDLDAHRGPTLPRVRSRSIAPLKARDHDVDRALRLAAPRAPGGRPLLESPPASRGAAAPASPVRHTQQRAHERLAAAAERELRDEAAAAAGRRGGAEAREAPVPVGARVGPGVADAPREDAARAGLRPRRPGRPARRRVLGGRGQRLVRRGGVRRAILEAPDAAPSDAISEISFNNTDAASVRTAQPPTLEQAALATYASSRVAVPAPPPRARPFAQAIATMGSVDEDWAAGAARVGPGGDDSRDSAAEYDSTAGAASLFSSLYSAATAPSTSSFIAACSTKVVGVVTANLFGPTMLQAAALFGAAPPAAAPAADLGGGDPPSVVAPVEPGGKPRGGLALADHLVLL